MSRAGLLHLLRSQTKHLSSSIFRSEPSPRFLPSANAIFARDNFYKRWIQTQTSLTSRTNDDLENQEAGSLKPVCDSADVSSHEGSNDNSAVKHTVFSNLKTSSRHDLAMMFTCKVCETRSVKTLCRESYEKGVVVARCGGCNNLHLIADHLGYFGEPGTIEELLAARGEEVKKGTVDSLNLTLEDLAGKEILKE